MLRNDIKKAKSPSKFGLERTLGILRRLEDGALVAFLMMMIGMTVTQIMLRNLFDYSIVWGDGLVRILVLWIGLVGGMVASRQGKHISIDVVARHLPNRAKAPIGVVVAIFVGLVCAVAAYHGVRFVQTEFQHGGMAFQQLPVWVCEAIIPFGFSVMALRYFMLSYLNLTQTLRPVP